ncbi:MAG: deoxyribonuclease IV [Thermoguttaceae bacterium]
MPIFGIHGSIAGGCQNAIREASRLGCKTVQLFCKASNQWRSKPLSESDVTTFRQEMADSSLTRPLVHTSYLINLGTAKADLYAKSIASLQDEILRTAQLGIDQIVIHPGTPSSDDGTTSSDRDGLKRIAAGFDEALACEPSVTILLETTAGQGSSLGWRFEHLAEIIGMSKSPERLRVCFDTCHVFAAGYPLTTESDYNKTMDEFDSIVGLDKLAAFHVNDSVKGSGSRVDRHAAIGRGMIGLELFRTLVNDKRFANLPMYLETPKGLDENGEELDAVNLRTLREMMYREQR